MKSFNLRLKDETHRKIAKIAEKQSRSLNKQIEYITETFIAEYEKINGKLEKEEK